MTFPEHKMVDSAATVDLLTLFVLQPTMKPSTQEHKIYIYICRSTEYSMSGL